MSFKPPSLTSGPVDLTSFRGDPAEDFLNFLIGLSDNTSGKKSIGSPCGFLPKNGTKALVLDGNLGGLLNLIIPQGSKALKKCGVQYFCDLADSPSSDGGGSSQAIAGQTSSSSLNFPLPPSLPPATAIAFDQPCPPPPPSYPSTIIFLVRPLPSMMPVLARQIKRRQAALIPGNQREVYTVCFTPRSDGMCLRILGDLGVGDHIETITEFPLGLVPLDDDLLTLGDPEVLPLFHRDGVGPLALEGVVGSLSEIERVCGDVRNWIGVGAAGEGVLRGSWNRRIEEEEEEAHRQNNEGDGDIESDGDDNGDGDVDDDDDGGGTGDEEAPLLASDIHTVILLDRSCDFVTPLTTPLTYEGLIDFVWKGGIRNGYVKVDELVVGGEAESENKKSAESFNKSTEKSTDKATTKSTNKKIPVSLNSTDPLFALLRNQNIETTGPFLAKQAQLIRESYSNFRENKSAKTIGEIHAFVKDLPGLTKNYQSLTQHIHIAEVVKKVTSSPEFREGWMRERGMLEGEADFDRLEDLISTRPPLWDVLRLLTLQSLTSNGIKSGRYDTIKREIVQQYGFESVEKIGVLEAMGAIRRKENLNFGSGVGDKDGEGGATGGNWSSLRTRMSLINDSVNISDPDDIAFVTSGYAPLSVRFIQAIVREETTFGTTFAGPGNKPSKGGLKTLVKVVRVTNDKSGGRNGPPTFEEVLERTKEEGSIDVSPPTKGGQETETQESKPVLLAYYVGGITYAEIAALRYLSALPATKFPFQIVIATTYVINGEKLIRSLVDC